RRVGEIPLTAHAHALADDRDSRLVVAPEYRGAVGADDVALLDGLHALARLDRVHVRAEKERRRVDGAGHVRDEVPGLALHLRARVVEADGGAERLELAGEPLRDAPLAAREAVDADQLEEQPFQAGRVDHARPACSAGAWQGQRRLSLPRAG